MSANKCLLREWMKLSGLDNVFYEYEQCDHFLESSLHNWIFTNFPAIIVLRMSLLKDGTTLYTQ